MPLKSLIKMSWSTSAVLFTLIIISGLVLFLSDSNADVETIVLEDHPVVNIEPLPDFQPHFEPIWQSRVNAKRPERVITHPIKENPRPTKPPLEQILKNNIIIKNIFTTQRAFIVFTNRPSETIHLIVAPAKRPSFQPPQDKWRWQLNLPRGGERVYVTRMIPHSHCLPKTCRCGIQFQAASNKKKAWLYYKSPFTKNSIIHRKSQKTAEVVQPRRKKVSDTHWKISQQEGEDLINQYDKLVSDLAPKQVARPKGLLIRRVPEVSVAYEYGLRKNDIINKINGRQVKSLGQIQKLIKEKPDMARLEITLLRKVPGTKKFKPVKYIFEGQ